MGGRNRKRRQSAMNNMSKSKSASYGTNKQEKIPRSLPPEKIFGIEDLKENDDIIGMDKNKYMDKLSINMAKKEATATASPSCNLSKNNDTYNKLAMGSISRSKSSSNTILNGKNLLISTSDDHGIVIMQQR